MTVAAALNYGDRAVFSVVLPALRTEFALSDAALGWLGSVFLWSYALLSPIAGALADRFSRTALVLLSLASWSLVTSLMGVLHSFGGFVVLRLALGMAESLYLPAAIGLIADHHGTSTRARAVGVHIVGMNVGIVAGGALAGVIAEHFGWRFSFLGLGLAGLALATVTRLFLSDVPSSVKVERLPKFSARAALRYLVRVRSFYVLLSVAMLAGVAVWIFFNWFPLYLRERYELSLGTAGLAAMLMLQVASMLGIVTGGWISDRAAKLDPRYRLLVFAGGYLAAAPCLLLFLLRPGFPTVCVAVASFSFLRALAGVNELPILCDVVPQPFRSTAVGIMNTAATAAGGVGVLVAAFLKQRFGLESVFGGLSAVYFLAALALGVGFRALIAADFARAKQIAA